MKKINLANLKGYLISLGIAVLTYLFFVLIINTDEEFYTLPLKVENPQLLAVANVIEKSVTVTLKGSPAALSRISRDDMSAVLNLKDITTAGLVRQQVEITRRGAFSEIDNLEVIINPNNIEVLLEDRITKLISINATYVNSLPKGYLFEGYKVTPSAVEISGPRSLLTELDTITTDYIDLSSLTRSSNRLVPLVLPDLINLYTLTVNEVTVFTNIREAISVQTFNNLTIKINNLEDIFDSTIISDASINLTIQGSQLILENIKPQVYIDASIVHNTGTFEFKVQTILPNEIELISISPETVIINITNSNVTSPTPDVTPQFVPNPEFTPPTLNLENSEQPNLIPSIKNPNSNAPD